MNNPEAFKEDEVRSIKFVVPGLPFGKQRPKVTVRKFTGSDGKEKKFAKAYTPEKTVNYENLVTLEIVKMALVGIFELNIVIIQRGILGGCLFAL